MHRKQSLLASITGLFCFQMSAVDIPSSLQKALILDTAFESFKAVLASLRAVSSVFMPSLIQTKTVDVPYYPLIPDANVDFDPDDGYVTNRSPRMGTVSFDTRPTADGGDFKRVYQPMSWTSAEWERYYWEPEKFGAMLGYALASGIITDFFSIFTSTNYSLSDEGAASAFTFNKLITSIGVKASENNWPETQRSLLLNAAFHANFMADPAVSAQYASGTNQVFLQGAVTNVAKWDILPSINGVPNNTAGNGGGTKKLSGVAIHPSAAAFIVAPLEPTDEVKKMLVDWSIITDVKEGEGQGLAFTHRLWGEPQKDKSHELIECRYAYKPIIPKDAAGDPLVASTSVSAIRIIRPS